MFRRERLLAELGSGCDASSLDDQASVTFWRAVRDVLPLAGSEDRAIWRVSVAPSRGDELGEAVSRRLDASWYLDWAGGLLWAAIAGAEDGGAAVIRDTIRGADGRGTGHATLIKGSPDQGWLRSAPDSQSRAHRRRDLNRCGPISRRNSLPIPIRHNPKRCCGPAPTAGFAQRPARPMSCSGMSSIVRGGAFISSRTCSPPAKSSPIRSSTSTDVSPV